MGPIALILQMMRTQFLNQLAKKALKKTVESRFGRKLISASAKAKGKTILPKKGPGIGSSYKSNLKNKAKVFDDLMQNKTYMNSLSDVELNELIKGMEYIKVQIDKSIKYGKAIQDIRKVQSIYKKATNLQGYATNKMENKIIELLFGGRKPKDFSKIADTKDLKDFEKRLQKFQKSDSNVKKFNKLMNGKDNDVNVYIALDSSWLWWGIWSPTKSMKKFGNVVLKVKPWVAKSSKNPSLIYRYGVGQSKPPMHYSVWKLMTKAHAGTTYWRKYIKVSSGKKRKDYYKLYKGKK